jgi:hypothetical protein
MADYEVGYGKPPQHTKYKPGQSGNLEGGRKHKKRKDPKLLYEQMNAMFLEEAYRLVPGFEGNKEIKIPVIRGLIRTLMRTGAKGSVRALRFAVEKVASIEQQNTQQRVEYYKSLLEYKAKAEEELQRRKQLNIRGPDIVPHPDDIIYDPNTGRVVIVGPRTDHELWLWDHVEDTLYAIKWLKSLTPEEKKKMNYRKSLALEYKILRKFLEALPNYWNCPSRRTRWS